MGQALYRKYRSKSFKDVVGQLHITATLQNAIKSGRVSHAYLFTGPRGVGKTSVARILAHEVNSLDYIDDSIHMDIIEIDAASNRRIDEIRELRDRVSIAPTSAKFKVYIIDEVHMLTREAFNALLKTLEEPPAHCIFILATTEAHKLPETIVSRTQRFEFKPVNKNEISKHLSSIAKSESIEIDSNALDLLAEFGSGSFRDSISYLDQLSSIDKKITVNEVEKLLGIPPLRKIERILTIIKNGDSAELLAILKELQVDGINAQAIASSISNVIREQAVSEGISTWQIDILEDLLKVYTSAKPQELLEIVLLQAVSKMADDQPHAVNNENKAAILPENKVVIEKKVNLSANKSSLSSAAKSNFDLKIWEELVERSKKQAASIYTALRLAQPTFEGNTLTLSFQFPLHQKKLDQAKNKQLVSLIAEELTGQKIKIETAVSEKVQNKSPEIKSLHASSISSISSIFGNTEVMEA